jgi:hypothetical protein
MIAWIGRASLLASVLASAMACGGKDAQCSGAAAGQHCEETACSGSTKKYKLCLFGDPNTRCSQASYSTLAGELKRTCVCADCTGNSSTLDEYNSCALAGAVEACQ